MYKDKVSERHGLTYDQPLFVFVFVLSIFINKVTINSLPLAKLTARQQHENIMLFRAVLCCFRAVFMLLRDVRNFQFF
jgi:hypothetical protein